MVQQVKKQFIVTEGGRKTAVLLPLKEYFELLEDLEDLAIIAERKDEPSVPFEAVKKKLEQKWRRTVSK
jgi:PHD/YefM family antitoxin component YafN of YafNO toxin-antitoxin module